VPTDLFPPLLATAGDLFQGVLLSARLLLAAGGVGGALARLARLPALTGHVLAGLCLGPLPLLLGLPAPPWQEHFGELAGPVNDFAMALVLFVLGGHFRVESFRRLARPLLTVSLLESLATAVVVTLATLPLLHSLPGSLLLGLMAVAVAPAPTLAVLQEYRADGPLTEAVTLLTGLSNVLAIIAFEALLLALLALGGGEGGVNALPVLWDLAGSVLFGVLAGQALIVLQERVGFGNYALPLMTAICLTIGLCQVTDTPHMLAFLVTGAVVANRSRFFEPICGAMEAFAAPAYVAFFVLSGWHMELSVFTTAGAVVAVYVLARSLGKVAGTRLAMVLARFRPGARPQAGLALLCQAGAAIALASAVGRRLDPDLGQALHNVIMGAVLIFELAGPLLLRHAVVAAGEVPLGRLVSRLASDGDRPHWREAMLRAFRGHRPSPEQVRRLTAGRLMRAGNRALREGAGLDEVLHFANHSPFNHLPVVSDDGRLIGLIAVADLDQVAYDPQAAVLVIAADLAALSPEEAALPAGTSLEEAAAFFRRFRGNTAAVVAEMESRRFLGMIERSEVLRLMRVLRQGSRGDPS